MLLMTQNEVIAQAFTDKRFLTSKITVNVILACQYKYIRPILGSRLYDTVCNKIINNSISFSEVDLYNQLLNKKIKPSLAYFVKSVIALEGENELTNTGVHDFNSRTSKAAEWKAVQRKSEISQVVAEALASEITLFLEKHQESFDDYVSGENIQKRISHPFGIVLKRKKRPTKIWVTDRTIVPNCFKESIQVSSESWLINYEGKIKNEDVKVVQVLDSQGNDITQYINPIWNREAQTVLIEFLDDAWIDETNKTGTIEFCIADVVNSKNTLLGEIQLTDNQATFELLMGSVVNPTYKWYWNDTLLGQTGTTISIENLQSGILYCEIWENGQRKLRVFHRLDCTEGLTTEDGEFTLTTEGGQCLVEDEENDKSLTTNDEELDLTDENGNILTWE